VSIETSAFGQYFEYFSSRLNFVHVSKLEVILQDMLLIVFSLAFGDDCSELTFCNEVLAVEVILLFAVHF
jgi:hypothetical protein